MIHRAGGVPRTQENRPLVADELAATAGEDWRQPGQARPVLLAPVGRGPSDAPSFRGGFADDLGVTVAGGVAIDSWREVGEERGKEGEASGQPARKQASSEFSIRGKGRMTISEGY